MKKEDLIDTIKNFVSTILGDKKDKTEVNFEQSTLEDGMIVEYEVLEAKQSIMIVLETGNVILPTGDYIINGNNVAVVDGVITEVVTKKAEDVSKKAIVDQTALNAKLKDELNAKLKDELNAKLKDEYDAKLNAKLKAEKVLLQADYDTKLSAIKEKVEVALSDLTKKVNSSVINKAPGESKPVIMSTNEIMARDLESQRNANKI